jgi:hypothetical protein
MRCRGSSKPPSPFPLGRMSLRQKAKVSGCVHSSVKELKKFISPHEDYSIVLYIVRVSLIKGT